ncbi:MAG TPA: hypothetical protein DIT58_06990 [Porticoccaceae bacterium]|nr:hypothetical protein [Porticoccaceae bacterium]
MRNIQHSFQDQTSHYPAWRPVIRLATLLLVILVLTGCATLSNNLQPPLVTVTGLEPLPGQGLAPKLRVQLELQNRNNEALQLAGLDFDLAIDGRRFASGVSNRELRLPPLGTAETEVEITLNGFNVARQLFQWLQQPPDDLNYAISGHLHLTRGIRRKLAFNREGSVPLQQGLNRSSNR